MLKGPLCPHAASKWGETVPKRGLRSKEQVQSSGIALYSNEGHDEGQDLE
jgi:hypothetical protein